jgi:predicted dehydrogenase
LGVGLIRMAGGITFFIEEAWAINLGGTDGSKIAGSKGGITLTPFTYHATIGDMEMNAVADLKNADTRWGRVFPETKSFHGDQEHWLASLRGEAKLVPTAEIGQATMLISEGIYLSQKLGREVKPDEVLNNSVSTAIKM